MRPSAFVTTSAPRKLSVSWLNFLACAFPYRRLTSHLAMDRPRLGARVGGYSFLPIGLSPNIHCQLAWRTTTASTSDREPGRRAQRQSRKALNVTPQSWQY